MESTADDFLVGAKCAICLEIMNVASATALPCTHAFHGDCVAQLRNIGVSEVCPLCRTPLPPGPEKVFEEATRCFMVVFKRVERGEASWSALPPAMQQDVDADVSGWQTAATSGDVGAQYNLGQLFDSGQGVVQDYAEAAKWYTMAAEDGFADAQHKLGILYVHGRGVPQSYKIAVQWYKKAAVQGFVESQFNLGTNFERGRGVPQSYKEAARWFRMAADQGNREAQFSLAVLYCEGRGVTQSKKEAARWYKKQLTRG